MRLSTRALLVGTLMVGVLDILEPIVFFAFRGVKPMRILQSVAAGLLGRDAATSGGWTTALLGLALHFFIAFCVVLVYHLAATKFDVLTRHPILLGTIYGLGVWTVMNFVVLPLSAVGPPRFTPVGIANGFFAHIVCVGIPAAYSTRVGVRRRVGVEFSR